tara:strand:- start:45 stop:650 length:606 start_codon:yes stop_codon:yes gene_type:complete
VHLWFVHWNFRFFIFRGRRRVEDELRVDRLHFVIVTRPDPDPNAAIVVVVVVLAVVVVVVVDTRRRRRRRRPIRVLSRCDDDVGVSSRSSLLNVDERRRLVLGAAAASGNAHDDDDTTEREEQKKTISLPGLLSSLSLSLSLSLSMTRGAQSSAFKEGSPTCEKGKRKEKWRRDLRFEMEKQAVQKQKKEKGCPIRVYRLI